MLLIQTALRCEAEPFIQHYHLVKDDTMRPYTFFRGDNTALLISGVGHKKSKAATEWIFTHVQPSSVDLFANIGIAGSQTHPVGTPVLCTAVVNAETKEQLLLKAPHDTELHQGILETHLAPVGSLDLLVHQDSLVDMEAFFCISAALQFLPQKRIQSVKVISDALSDKRPTKQFVTQLMHESLPKITAEFSNHLTS